MKPLADVLPTAGDPPNKNPSHTDKTSATTHINTQIANNPNVKFDPIQTDDKNQKVSVHGVVPGKQTSTPRVSPNQATDPNKYMKDLSIANPGVSGEELAKKVPGVGSLISPSMIDFYNKNYYKPKNVDFEATWGSNKGEDITFNNPEKKITFDPQKAPIDPSGFKPGEVNTNAINTGGNMEDHLDLKKSRLTKRKEEGTDLSDKGFGAKDTQVGTRAIANKQWDLA